MTECPNPLQGRVAKMLLDGRQFRRAIGLPDDVILRAAWIVPERYDCLAVVVEHRELRELRSGELIPEVVAEFESAATVGEPGAMRFIGWRRI